jgi:hypothetical protein
VTQSKSRTTANQCDLRKRTATATIFRNYRFSGRRIVVQTDSDQDAATFAIAVIRERDAAIVSRGAAIIERSAAIV